MVIVRLWKGWRGARDSAVLGGLVGVKQSLRLDGRKVCNIKRVGISQAESNKATVCVLPPIHLPLTREARMWCGKGSSAFEKVVGMAVFGATGGASPSPYEKRV